MTGTVKIINYNDNANSIVSAAGRISTTKGSADEIYGMSCGNEQEKNLNLIDKILSSGHESVIEHIFFNLSFDNVSVFAEQFMIEFRLASFTVKSRRYVDFGKMGYYEPESVSNSKNDELKQIYNTHMNYLFDEYNYFIEAGIPKEDARFVLPYSFRSNFYCSANGRELVKIMNELVYGRGRKYPELVELGQSLFEQCESILPYLAKRKNLSNCSLDIFENKVEETHIKKPLVTVLNGPKNPEETICKAAALNYGGSIQSWSELEFTDIGQQKLIIKELLKNSRKREFEQVNFTVLFHKMSLAGITHLVRHRMQSIIIPEYINSCDYSQYVIPKSIVEAGLRERYQKIFVKSQLVSEELNKLGLYSGDNVYLFLSGMTVSVMTTMNLHELYHFFKLRVCNRAQWEIKECGDELLQILRKEYPVLFSFFGPTCYVDGKCSEGKMTCGKKDEVCKFYSL